MSTQGQTADQEFLERLDQAVGCQQCGGPLGQSVSDDFCRPSCQQAWFSQHAEPLPATVDPWHTWADSHPYGDATLPTGETAERYEGDAPVPVRSGFDLSAGYMGLNEVRRLVFRPGNHSADVRPRPWRLPRSTGELFRDENALAIAEWTARTDAQRAACALRRKDLEERRRQRPRPPFPGRAASWEFDHHASPLVHSRITWDPTHISNFTNYVRRLPDVVDEVSFGERAWNNLPGIRESTFQARGHYRQSQPAMLRYELRRDSDETLMAVYACPDGQQISLELPPYTDTTGCSWRILNSRGEVIRQFPVTSRRLWATPDPAPAVNEGDTIQVTHDGQTLRYTVEAVGPGSSMTLRRHPQDDQPQIQGAEFTHALIDETTPATPQARALQGRRNRNTGPTPRPGRTSGNVPGARR